MPRPESSDRPLDPQRLDELWDFDDPAASEGRLRAELDRVDASSVAAMELATQIARALGLQGRFDEADALLDTVATSHTLVLSRASLERGRLRNSSGDRAAATRLFASALGHATMGGHAYLAVDAAHMLAIVDEPNAASWVRQGLEIIEASDDPRARRWWGVLHNNLGWTCHDRGDFDAALKQFEQALAAYRETGTEAQIHAARWSVARCLRSLGRRAEALAIQRRLAAEDSPDPFVEEEIAALTGPNTDGPESGQERIS